jgi:hypothetical protein
MALSTEHKLYIGVGVLAVLGIAVYVQQNQNKEERASYSAETAQAALPKIEVTEADTKAVTKIEITKPGKKDATEEKDKKPLTVVLEKKGEDWELTSPVKATANKSNVESLLSNLEKLEMQDRIASGTDQYEKYEVDDKQAVHAIFGKSGGRGQMTRVHGKDGVYAVKGYSSYTYSRDVKGWRDRTIFKFDEKKVKTASLANETGTFEFAKDGDSWKGTFAKGALPALPIADFDPKKVDDMLRAFKNLNADDFGDDKKKSDVGLEEPIATLKIVLDDGAKRILTVGDNAKGESRWAMKNGSDQIFSISSWSGNWATSELEKFQKKEGDKDKDEDDDKPMKIGGPGMAAPPPGMGGPPPGHP